MVTPAVSNLAQKLLQLAIFLLKLSDLAQCAAIHPTSSKRQKMVNSILSMVRKGNAFVVFFKRFSFPENNRFFRQIITIRYHLLPFITINGSSILKQPVSNIPQNQRLSNEFYRNLDIPKVR